MNKYPAAHLLPNVWHQDFIPCR